jgi:hypothetical protein
VGIKAILLAASHFDHVAVRKSQLARSVDCAKAADVGD